MQRRQGRAAPAGRRCFRARRLACGAPPRLLMRCGQGSHRSDRAREGPARIGAFFMPAGRLVLSGWRGGFRRGPLRTLDALLPTGDFAPISGHEERGSGLRSPRRTSRSTSTQAPAGEPPADSPSRTRRRCTAKRLFVARQIYAAPHRCGRIALKRANDDLGGSGGLCQPAKLYVVVRRCRALPARLTPAGPRSAERC